MTTPNIYLVLVSILGGGAVWLVGKYLQKRELLELSRRERLSDSQIYENFYSSSRFDERAVMSIWHEVSTELEIESGLLRPTDEFGKTFAKNWLTNGGLEGLEFKAWTRAKKLGSAVDLSKIRTIDDYIRTFAQR